MTDWRQSPWDRTTPLPKPIKAPKKPRRRIPRGARPRAVRATSTAEEKRECDRIARALVFQRDHATCVACGSTQYPQWAHIVSRGYWRTRWLEENAVVLCRRCHKKFTEDPAGWDLWVADYFGRVGKMGQRTGDAQIFGKEKLWLLKIQAKCSGWHYDRRMLLALRQTAKERGIEEW
jgi:5-methylcytosine-specific restriction endonuclease McrA